MNLDIHHAHEELPGSVSLHCRVAVRLHDHIVDVDALDELIVIIEIGVEDLNLQEDISGVEIHPCESMHNSFSYIVRAENFFVIKSWN